MGYFLGIDLGSSSIKVALMSADTGRRIGQATAPSVEMAIVSPEVGWAEQDPEIWWQELKNALAALKAQYSFDPTAIKAIGISYQMHGLVLVDKAHRVLRPSIIWCDSRAVDYGSAATARLGVAYCQEHLLNELGNFTASKLAWVKDKEPALFERIHKVLLPGDFLALRLTDQAATTASGLSEGIFWDFKKAAVSQAVLDILGFSADILPDIVPTSGFQGTVTAAAAAFLGLRAGTPVTYRAGDQPNNAFSLQVLQPGEVAANAGTSGVVYGVSAQVRGDAAARVNAFLHTNHTAEQTRIGLLMCLNGTGILNSWARQNFASDLSYDQMTALAQTTPIGAAGLSILPFGNGSERLLQNRQLSAMIDGLQFNQHHRGHIFRAVQEGIVYALAEGVAVMSALDKPITTIRAGAANLFLSPLFREAFANTTGATIELYEVDGALGAARAAGLGLGYYKSASEAFVGWERLAAIDPEPALQAAYTEGYLRWQAVLHQKLS